MKKIATFLTAIAILLTPALEARTPTSYEDIEAFLKAAPEQYGFMELSSAGQSVEGRELHLLQLNRGKHPDPWRILFVGAQHGDEIAGTEACLDIIRHYGENPEEFPSDIDLWILPVANPDGYRQGRRRNAANADINRDHVILSQPETRALHALARRLMPHVTVDCHEYSRDSRRYVERGYVRWPLIMMDRQNHPLLPDSLKEAAQWWVDAPKPIMETADVSYTRYYVGGPPPDQELRYSTLDSDDHRNGIGMYGGFSFIIESGVLFDAEDPQEDLAERVRAYTMLLRHFIESDEKRAEHKVVIEATRAQKLSDFIPTNFFWGNTGANVVDYPMQRLSDGGTDIVQTPNFMQSVITKRSHPRPDAYAIIDDTAAAYRNLLDAHGIVYTVLEEDRAATITRFKLDRIESNFDEVYQRYAGRQIVSRIPESESNLPAGTLYIPLDGANSWRIPAILEPNMLYGLYQWEQWRATLGTNGEIPIVWVTK